MIKTAATTACAVLYVQWPAKVHTISLLAFLASLCDGNSVIIIINLVTNPSTFSPLVYRH